MQIYKNEDFALLAYPTMRNAVMAVAQKYAEIAHPDTLTIRVPAAMRSDVQKARKDAKIDQIRPSANAVQMLHKTLPNAKGETEVTAGVQIVIDAIKAAEGELQALGVIAHGDVLILASDAKAVAQYGAEVESSAPPKEEPTPAPAPASEEAPTSKKGRKKKADNENQ
jgi:hypothetical protein